MTRLTQQASCTSAPRNFYESTWKLNLYTSLKWGEMKSHIYRCNLSRLFPIQQPNLTSVIVGNSVKKKIKRKSAWKKSGEIEVGHRKGESFACLFSKDPRHHSAANTRHYSRRRLNWKSRIISINFADEKLTMKRNPSEVWCERRIERKIPVFLLRQLNQTQIERLNEKKAAFTSSQPFPTTMPIRFRSKVLLNFTSPSIQRRDRDYSAVNFPLRRYTFTRHF